MGNKKWPSPCKGPYNHIQLFLLTRHVAPCLPKIFVVVEEILSASFLSLFWRIPFVQLVAVCRAWGKTDKT